MNYPELRIDSTSVNEPTKIRFRRNSYFRIAIITGFCITVLFALIVSSVINFDLVKELVTEVSYARLPTVREKLNLIDYFLKMLGEMEPSPSGKYLIPVKEEDSNFERANKYFHLGKFDQAIKILKKQIESNKTEENLFLLAMSYLNRWRVSNNKFLYSLPVDKLDPAANEDLSQASLILQELIGQHSNKQDTYLWLSTLISLLQGHKLEDLNGDPIINSSLVSFFYNQSKANNLTLHESSHDLGLDLLDTGKGLAVEDFNNDGFMDLVTGSSFGQLRYFINDHGKKFIEATTQAGLDGILQPYSIIAVDYNNDGFQDLFVTCPFHHYRLLKNNNGSSFSDVTTEVGIVTPDQPPSLAFAWHSAWGDVDNDGDLDLFISQWGQRMSTNGPIFSHEPESSKLFINKDGKFSDQTVSFGLSVVTKNKNFVSAAFGDVDGDGFLDLFLSSFSRTKSLLLHNQGGRSFRKTDNFFRTEGGYTSTFLDYNQDGRLDLFQSGNAPAGTVIRNLIFENNFVDNANAIFFQNPTGHFIKDTSIYIDHFPIPALGATYGDLNNDGCYDFFFGTGNPEPWFILPNLLYLGEEIDGKCSGRLINVSNQYGIGSLEKGQAAVFFDFDNDGDLDIYSVLGGLWPGDRGTNKFFINDSVNLNNWIKIRLRGRETNYFGVNAKIVVYLKNSAGQIIPRYYTVDNKTGYGSAPYLAHIGLGQSNTIDHVEVYWPGSKLNKKYQVIENQLNILDEHDGISDAKL